MSNEAWAEEAYAALRRWAKYAYRVNGHPITVETMRGFGQFSELDKPNDLRWWGPVVQRAIKEKVLMRKGWALARSSHNSPKRTYVGTKYA